MELEEVMERYMQAKSSLCKLMNVEDNLVIEIEDTILHFIEDEEEYDGFTVSLSNQNGELTSASYNYMPTDFQIGYLIGIGIYHNINLEIFRIHNALREASELYEFSSEIQALTSPINICNAYDGLLGLVGVISGYAFSKCLKPDTEEVIYELYWEHRGLNDKVEMDNDYIKLIAYLASELYDTHGAYILDSLVKFDFTNARNFIEKLSKIDILIIKQS